MSSRFSQTRSIFDVKVLFNVGGRVMFKKFLILVSLFIPSVTFGGDPTVHGDFTVDFDQSTVTYQIHHEVRF